MSWCRVDVSKLNDRLAVGRDLRCAERRKVMIENEDVVKSEKRTVVVDKDQKRKC